MAYYSQDIPDYNSQYFGYQGQQPNQYHQHQNNRNYNNPNYNYNQQYQYPPGHPYYQYNYNQGEGYPPGYAGYPPYNGSGAPNQPQQPRAGDSRKGLNIVDPKEREAQRAAAAASAAAGEGSAPPAAAPKKAALPIKDPVTKKPINLDQPQDKPAPQPETPEPAPVAAPEAKPPAPAPQKRKALPILDPLTRKEVVAAKPESAGESATKAPETISATPEAKAKPEAEEPADSSSTEAPASSEPVSAPSESSTSVTDEAPVAETTEAPATESTEEAVSSKVSAPAPAAEPETLSFRPGASWGTPKLPKQSTTIDTPTPKPNGVATSGPKSGDDEDAGSELEKPDSDAEETPKYTGGPYVCKPHPSGRRVYEYEFLISVSATAAGPPDSLRNCEVYLLDGRARRGQPSTPDSKGRIRGGFGGKTATPNYSGSNKVGHFDGNMRNQMGKVFVPGKSSYEVLTNRADTAFNVTNARNISEDARVLKKVRGILNRITPEKYATLFEQLWSELYSDQQVDVMGIVEQVIHTVFDIALDQPKFSFLYADVCFHLCRKIQTLKENEGEENKDEATDGKGQSATLKEFRRILLNTCQQRFEEGSRHQQTVIPPDATDEEREAIEKAEYKFKSRSLGNIKFIAELFKRSLLSERIMHIVIKILLIDTDHTDPRNVESMETLNEMLNTVGKKLDRQQAKPHMDTYFAKMAEVAEIHPIKRIKFLILNMIELRKANWVTRQDQRQTSGADDDGPPMSGGPVHRGQSKNFGRTPSWNNGDGNNRGGGGGGGGGGNISRQSSYNQPQQQEQQKPKKQIEDSGFQTVGKSGAKNDAWQKSAQQQQPAAPKMANNFALLGGGGGGRRRNQDNQQQQQQKEQKEPISPKSTEDSSPKDIPDEKIAAKGRGLLEEYTANPNDTENALAVLKEEIPNKAFAQFVCGMILGAVSQNKRDKERAALPQMCALFVQQELIEPTHMHNAFVATMEKAKREELWVDVPKLWANIAIVLAGCFNAKIVDLEVLAPMSEVLINDEDYKELAPDFLKAVVGLLDQEEYSGAFDADTLSDKLTKVLAAVTKAVTKKKSKSKVKVSSVEEFVTALGEVPFE